jgi:hypothetical protein
VFSSSVVLAPVFRPASVTVSLLSFVRLPELLMTPLLVVLPLGPRGVVSLGHPAPPSSSVMATT